MRITPVIVSLLVLSLAVAAASCRADDTATQAAAVVAQRAPSIVMVRIVLKMEVKANGQSRSGDNRIELPGTVVDPAGVIMISNAPFSPDKVVAAAGMTPGTDYSISMVPTDFKVIFEHDDTEYPATIATADSNLSLTFLQIQDLKGKQLTPVTFTSTTTPTLGELMVVLDRTSRGYDYAPEISVTRVASIIDKPQTAYAVPAGSRSLGLPAFTLDGDTAGIFTLVPSGLTDDAPTATIASALQALSNPDGLPILLVPNSTVAPVVAAAIARAADLRAHPPAPVATPAPATPAVPAATTPAVPTTPAAPAPAK